MSKQWYIKVLLHVFVVGGTYAGGAARRRLCGVVASFVVKFCANRWFLEPQGGLRESNFSNFRLDNVVLLGSALRIGYCCKSTTHSPALKTMLS